MDKTSRVRPSISESMQKGENDDDENKKSMNLFEVLEDRYAYEGFNKFLFFFFFFIILYQWLLSGFHSINLSDTKNFLKNRFVVPYDQFGRKQYNAWGLEIVKSVIYDPDFFGDNLALMRISMNVMPTLCNNTEYRSKIKYHEASRARTYEDQYKCAAVTSQNNPKGLEEIMTLLKSKYEIFSEVNEGWLQISVPIYSAEIHPQNRSKVVNNQLNGLEAALSEHHISLRLYEIVVEVLDIYNHMWYCVNFYFETGYQNQYRI
jgi:hypothetical protein